MRHVTVWVARKYGSAEEDISAAVRFCSVRRHDAEASPGARGGSVCGSVPRGRRLSTNEEIQKPAGFQLRLEELLEARRPGSAEDPQRVSGPHRHPGGADRRRLRVHDCGAGSSFIPERDSEEGGGWDLGEGPVSGRAGQLPLPGRLRPPEPADPAGAGLSGAAAHLRPALPLPLQSRFVLAAAVRLLPAQRGSAVLADQREVLGPGSPGRSGSGAGLSGDRSVPSLGLRRRPETPLPASLSK